MQHFRSNLYKQLRLAILSHVLFLMFRLVYMYDILEYERFSPAKSVVCPDINKLEAGFGL